MKNFTYATCGVCSIRINIQIEGDMIKKVVFKGGCHGNTQGIARLAEGRPVAEVMDRLKGIDCGGKGTSCPDQLARALERILSGLCSVFFVLLFS
ncbi:MAG: TIGR03905 family TSCPD domain-containing protein [Bacillota bacterium]